MHPLAVVPLLARFRFFYLLFFLVLSCIVSLLRLCVFVDRFLFVFVLHVQPLLDLCSERPALHVVLLFVVWCAMQQVDIHDFDEGHHLSGTILSATSLSTSTLVRSLYFVSFRI